MSTDSLFRTKDSLNISFSLRTLEARDFIVGIVDFIFSGDFLFMKRSIFLRKGER